MRRYSERQIITGTAAALALLSGALQQPNYEQETHRRNVAFRIPLQVVWPRSDRVDPRHGDPRQHELAFQREAFPGNQWTPHLVPNNGTISRFGWKAQNASITMFAGEAYNVEMGITNDLFPISGNADDDCMSSYAPFDQPRVNESYDNPLKTMPGWLMFTEFMRFDDAPHPAPLSASAMRVEELFSEVGCALCRTPSFRTAGIANPQQPRQEIGPHTTALRGQTVSLYSDLLVHRMGATLADNIVQGNAGPDEFRTTPLWSLGQRLFFLHDGRTSNLLVAIRDHKSA